MFRISELWLIPRYVRAIRQACVLGWQRTARKQISQLILLNSRRSRAALQELFDDSATRYTVCSFDPDDLSDADLNILGTVLRSRLLPWDIRKAVITGLCSRFTDREDVLPLFQELLQSGNPERSQVLFAIVGVVESEAIRLEERLRMIEFLVSTAPQDSLIQEMFRMVPGRINTPSDISDSVAILDLYCRLIVDQSRPLEIRMAMLGEVDFGFLPDDRRAALYHEVLLTGPHEMMSLVLKQMSHRRVTLPVAVIQRVEILLTNVDPMLRLDAAKALAQYGEASGVDYLLRQPQVDMSIVSALRQHADRRVAPLVVRAYQECKSVYHSTTALDVLEECLNRDAAGISQSVLEASLKIPRQLTVTDEIAPPSDEERRNYEYQYENTAHEPLPTTTTYFQRVVRDNSNLLDLATREAQRRTNR